MKILLKSLHEHFLHFRPFVDQTSGSSCANCRQAFQYSTLSCEDCGFWVHSICLAAHLPPTIEGHPLHSQHPLKLSFHQVVLCDKCLYLFDEVPIYSCHADGCSVRFDFCCILSTNDEHSTESGSLVALETKIKAIRHFSHEEKLYLCKGRKLIKKHCRWCNLAIDDDQMTYSCRFCRFILHVSCLNLIPSTVQHPFHPLHPLRMKYDLGLNTKCNACKNKITIICKPRCFACEDCNFFLHIGCANFLKPSLIHHCHEHKLTYFRKKDHEDHLIVARTKVYEEKFFCKSCGVDCALRSSNGFYRCVECDINFHVECVPILGTAEHKNHIHPLTLMNSYLEDDFEEYYCDVCEDKRDAENPVYCCEDCKYVAHIECVVNEKKASPEQDDVPKLESMKPDLKQTNRKNDYEVLTQEATWQKEAGLSTGAEFPSLAELDEAVSDINQIRHFSHNSHLMRLTEIDDNEGNNRYCNCCREKLCGSVYTCESCQFHLHKNCAELPREIQHPLHPQPYSFTLLTKPPFWRQYFICNACGYLSSGFHYNCGHCWLSLDLKCARLGYEGQKVEKLNRKIIRFKHEHEMVLGNCVEADDLNCGRCQLQISGPVCCCLSCNFFIHETCSKLPFKIDHPCHPQHPLLAEGTHKHRCYGCKLALDGIRYFCGECDLTLHLICANSLTRALKHNSHKHKLYYFGKDILRFFQKYGSRDNEIDTPCYKCNLCGEICDRPFYRCVKCPINLHLECMQIPPVAISKSHIHPLTLMDSFREDDFGQYYCDACETERNPDHHVYYCDECKFFAHVECAICEEEVGDPEEESVKEEEEEEEESNANIEESNAGEENTKRWKQ